jgi:hypothetical protein
MKEVKIILKQKKAAKQKNKTNKNFIKRNCAQSELIAYIPPPINFFNLFLLPVFPSVLA